jgi:hypothetical protein
MLPYVLIFGKKPVWIALSKEATIILHTSLLFHQLILKIQMDGIITMLLSFKGKIKLCISMILLGNILLLKSHIKAPMKHKSLV